jgi:hypothetical protein
MTMMVDDAEAGAESNAEAEPQRWRAIRLAELEARAERALASLKGTKGRPQTATLDEARRVWAAYQRLITDRPNTMSPVGGWKTEAARVAKWTERVAGDESAVAASDDKKDMRNDDE